MRYTVMIPNQPTATKSTTTRTALPMPSSYSSYALAEQPSFTEPFIFFECPSLAINSLAGWERYLHRQPNAVISCGPIEQLTAGFFEKARLAQRFRKRLPNYKKVRIDLYYRFDPDGFQFYKLNEKVE